VRGPAAKAGVRWIVREQHFCGLTFLLLLFFWSKQKKRRNAILKFTCRRQDYLPKAGLPAEGRDEAGLYFLRSRAA
jgi:hypothetical protein